MSFKLEHSNKNGTFSISLNRELSKSEMIEVCQIAANLIQCDEQQSDINMVVKPGELPIYGPVPPPELSPNQQASLGERPVNSINIGTYVEPSDGVRIKILNMVRIGRIPVIKTMKDITGISMIGCKEILYGNIECPILSIDTARSILEVFREHEIYAKLVPAHGEES